MRILIAFCILGLVPAAQAHGALTLNEFDTYALSDFEGHEDSFAWEGWEIWDIYAGDGYHDGLGGHGVYFKGNFAGDGTLRPLGGSIWELQFSWRVGGETFARSITHDGTAVESDFDAVEWQIADGNVFQIHAWAIVAQWQDLAIEDLVVVSLVDGEPRDIAPGGIYDPATGTEVPVNAPPTPVFPEIGEGRIVEAVPLTGAAKFLDVNVSALEPGLFQFTVKNPLAAQGQHLMVHVNATPAWNVEGAPNPSSLDGGAETTFALRTTPLPDAAVVAPLRVDLLTDIGGMQSYWVYATQDGVAVTDEPTAASTLVVPPPAEEAAGLPIVLLLGALALATLRRR